MFRSSGGQGIAERVELGGTGQPEEWAWEGGDSDRLFSTSYPKPGNQGQIQGDPLEVLVTTREHKFTYPDKIWQCFSATVAILAPLQL